MNFQILAILFSLCSIAGGSLEVVAGEDVMTPLEMDSGHETAKAEPAETPAKLVSGFVDEVEEEKQRLEKFKRLEKYGEEKRAQQHETDKAWIERYESVFFGSKSIDTEELTAILRDLYTTYADTSNSKQLKTRVRNVFNLIKMKYIFANNCNNGDFQKYNALTDKYSKGFSSSIVNYVQYQRSKFLKTCVKTFSDILKIEDGLAESTEREALYIVDRVLAANSRWQTKEPWLMNGISSFVGGIVDYTRSKLGKRAHKESEIEVLFRQTIKPVCSSVVDRFTGQDEIVKLIKRQEEVRKGLNERSIKWLTALRICELIKEDPELLQNKTHSTLLEQRRSAKGLGCFGGCFN